MPWKRHLLPLLAGGAMVAAPALAKEAAPGHHKPAGRPPVQSQALSILLAKEAIREQLTLYALLIDGDGKGRDPRAWADRLWTEDATFQVFDADGKSIFGNDVGLRGRAAIFAMFGRSLPENLPFAVRHVFGNPYFDEITATTARTRTIGFVIRGDKAEPEPGAAQRPLAAYVFHDVWRRGTDGTWRKAMTTVYCGVGCARTPTGPRPK